MQPWQIFPLPKAAPKWEQEAEAYWNGNPALAAEHIFPPNRKAADKTDEEAGNHTNYQTQKINQCHPEVLCGAWNSVGKYGGSVKLQKGLSAAAVPKSHEMHPLFKLLSPLPLTQAIHRLMVA